MEHSLVRAQGALVPADSAAAQRIEPCILSAEAGNRALRFVLSAHGDAMIVWCLTGSVVRTSAELLRLVGACYGLENAMRDRRWHLVGSTPATRPRTVERAAGAAFF